MAELAEFQRRHHVSLLCMVWVEVAGAAQIRARLGEAEAAPLLRQHAQVLRDLLSQFPGGLEVGSGSDAFFLVFEKPSDGVRFALQLHRRVALFARKTDCPLQDRIGIHVGEVLVEKPEGTTHVQGLNGIQVDVSEALLSLALPGHTLVTRFAFENARLSFKSGSRQGLEDLRWVTHGLYQLRAFDEAIEVCEVAETTLGALPPPPGNDRIRPLPGDGDAGDPWPVEGTETRLLKRVRHASRDEARAAQLGAVISALAGAVVLLAGWLDAPSYDTAYLFRSAAPPDEVVIVEMDQPSYLRLNQVTAEKWDRRLHAQLLDRLSAAGAKAVAFDVLFDNATAAEADAQFASALARAGNVVLAGALSPYTGVLERGHQIVPPAPPFRDLAPWGLAERSTGSEAIRQPAARLGSQPPSLAQLLASRAQTSTPPTPPDAWMNYYGPPGTIAHRSYASVLSNEVPAQVFSNRVVYVGANMNMSPASGLASDYFASPYSRWGGALISGVEINATSFANLVRGDWLRRLPPALEFALILSFGAGLGYLFVFFSPTRAMGLGLAAVAVLGLAGNAQVWTSGIWFPWLVLCGAQIPISTVWAILARTRLLAEEDRQLRKFLARRRAAALIRPTSNAGSGHPQAAVDDTAVMSPADQARVLATVPTIPDHSLLRRIGKGAYGEVWLARDIIGGFHAVKIVRRTEFADDGPFEREFRGLEKYNRVSRAHPNLVHILHVGRQELGGFLYYVMEVSDDVHRGQDIDPAAYQPRDLRGEISRRGRLPLPEVIACGIALADALAFLHRRGLVHRDLKPANIIFVHGSPKLADIGLITEVAAPGEEITLVGTQGFMPPEGHGSASADVYSLGKLLYVALTANPVKEFPDVPPDLTEAPGSDLILDFLDLLLQACEPIQADRLQTAEVFLAQLRPLAQRASEPLRDPARN